VITGFLLSVFFNQYAPRVLGNETLFYTAYPNGHGGFEIPFLIAMGLSFLFTMIVMILMSLAGPKVNPKAFAIDWEMFKVKTSTQVLILVTILILMALYVKFW
jgi:SSS family solute:Na+ symporter